MKEQELVGKIKTLETIKPNQDFGLLSRNLVLRKNAHPEMSADLKFSLLSLNKISPADTFVLKSRATILATSKRLSLKEIFAPQNIFKKNWMPAFATGLATLLIIAMASISTFLKAPVSPILSDAENNDLIKEAGTINKDIDVHLQQINYYALSASKSNVALNEASTSNDDHTNSAIIKQESDKASYNSPHRNQEVDNLLNQATF